MTLTFVLFILGFVFLIKGADILVEGASSVAKRFGLSNLMIGLTIVSFGTSAPELLVSMLSAFKGTTEIAIGNVIGSNISNIALILGTCAIIASLRVTRTTVWKEIPLNLLAITSVFILANDTLFDSRNFNEISRIDGIMLLFFFAIFMYYAASIAKGDNSGDEGDTPKKHSIQVAIGMILIGGFGLAFGGQWIVDGAIEIATIFGLSESLIALTIISIGTSLPELAASVVATLRGDTDIAVGNVVGSNLFNTFWILGATAIIKPLPLAPAMNTDILVNIGVTLLFFILMFVFSRQKSMITGKLVAHVLKRTEGILLLLVYVSYIGFLVWRG